MWFGGCSSNSIFIKAWRVYPAALTRFSLRFGGSEVATLQLYLQQQQQNLQQQIQSLLLFQPQQMFQGHQPQTTALFLQAQVQSPADVPGSQTSDHSTLPSSPGTVNRRCSRFTNLRPQHSSFKPRYSHPQMFQGQQPQTSALFLQAQVQLRFVNNKRLNFFFKFKVVYNKIVIHVSYSTWSISINVDIYIHKLNIWMD